MGIYSEYLDRQLSWEQLGAERKRQLKRISDIRGGRDVLVFAANLQSRQPIAINYSDLLPIQDQISNLAGNDIDIILETPGGSGETVEDIVTLLRSRYQSIGVIVPGVAKSAGTIFAMGADEILMDSSSSLGPIDAQMNYPNGKVFSAHAFLEGMNKIKEEVVSSGSLNKAYIPILQNVSPGEIQHAQNAYDFARDLVTDWLVKYKFKNWETRESSRDSVTPELRKSRAKEIAEQLRDHGKWKTHGRSIKMADLRAMRLLVTDYSDDPALCDAIRRYYTLLQMTFASNCYKIFETPQSQIMRVESIAQAPLPAGFPGSPGAKHLQPSGAEMIVGCNKCGQQTKLHAAFQKGVQTPLGLLPFPANSRLKCPNCGTELNLTDVRRQLEAQTGRPIYLTDGDADAGF